ncbi:hypothetical protein [Microbacterium sp. H1-D42]|uniref:hypothetical protein n=1 Tax=Microbacterium sp. H1-D42 TaxID=2925844 RepID=UPI001F539E09|nr:hypothetical protein [Microbacterium sp. H1-D42]UNK70803.1 hypothetical protein MNR00_16865 [Microbacterium sp. H1-D42]
MPDPPAAAPEAPAPAPKPRASAPPTPKPSASASAPSPAVPATPEPLAFTGITENRGPNPIGVEVVQSYTLSTTGEPGATASVTYGWKDAGSVTFAADESATLDIDRSVLLLIPGNARIRAEYSDGTTGDAIEARRKSI